MSFDNKVIWSEGMFLRPQHFQQQDRYLDQLLKNAITLSQENLWGIQDIAIDSELLPLGKVSVTCIRGVFSDQTIINAPDSQNLPDIYTIPENTRDTIVYLCVPLRRPGTQDSVADSDEAPSARYQMFNFDVRDNTSTATEPVRIQIGKLRTCLKLGSDDLSGYSAIGIAKIQEYTAGNPVKLDPSYIPPTMHCSSSVQLTAYLEEIIGLLKQRGDALGSRLSDAGRSNSSEIADYLLLQIINRVEPFLEHLRTRHQLHPLQLFGELLQLAGELATFSSKTKRPDPTPRYQHNNLQQCFAELFQSLRQSLSTVLEQSAISLNLTERKYGIHVAPVTDPSLTRTASFVLAAKASMPTEILRSRFPSQAKVAPVEAIRELISSQTPGLQMRALPVAPRQIPYHTDFVYFEIERFGDLWQSMQRSGGFAVHVGAEFPGLEMELWAIRY
ncbi:MAG TPA: type VI secretion system baseplate subunit TssK [Marinagarivorans sp.]